MSRGIKNAEQGAIESQTSETSAQQCTSKTNRFTAEPQQCKHCETKIDIAARYFMKS